MDILGRRGDRGEGANAAVGVRMGESGDKLGFASVPVAHLLASSVLLEAILDPR